MTKKHKKSAAKKPSGKSPGKKPEKLSRKDYEKQLEELQVELVRLQLWVKQTGAKVIVIFEGRDAAGKGGVIKRIMDRVSPRIFRVVALPTPTEREKTQMYVQRYIAHFPAAGEIVLFDRSWYNRAGVERVMGFCTDHEYRRFLKMVPAFEQTILDNDILLIKYWFDVSMDEQQRRFQERIDDERKIWKLSPMDTQSFNRWYDYSRARDAMFEATDTDFAPWYIVPANSQKRARLNCISHLLGLIPYKALPRARVKLGKRNLKDKYDDQASLEGRRFVPETF